MPDSDGDGSRHQVSVLNACASQLSMMTDVRVLMYSSFLKNTAKVRRGDSSETEPLMHKK